jgi:hypothetical protein
MPALPPDIPDAWLKKISETNRSQLQTSEIPDSWLRKIKEAAKPDLLSVVLGSSLLAALIAMGSAALTTYMTSKSAEKLEAYKLAIQAQNDQVKKRAQAYGTLARDLDSLASALDAYLRMSDIAAKVPVVSSSDLLAQREKVGLAEKEVLAAQKDIASYGGIVSGEIDACFVKLSPALAAAEKDPKVAASLKPILDQLKDLVFVANGEVNKSLAKPLS